MNSGVKSLADLIVSSKTTVVLTGAGISTPSGIPDFRSPQTGLWEKSDPYHVIALSTFYSDPAIFYDWLYPLAVQLKTAAPNPAHTALVRLEEMGFINAILTQNIDGLHQKAGSRNVYELHGSLEEMVCLGCDERRPSGPFWQPFLERKELPCCPSCGKVLKPDIVFFEEQLPDQAWNSSEFLCRSAGLVIVMGSSLEVVPANQLPVTAVRHGSRLAIINRASTPLDRLADCLVRANIEEVLPELVDVLGITRS